MTVTNLNVFQSGTLASVTPVNENFETLRVAINTVEQANATNRTYIDTKIAQTNSSISSSVKSAKISGEVFCVNSGSFDVNGIPAIMSISGMTLSFATPFVATNINGDVLNASIISDVSLSGYADGTYNVFVDTDENRTILKNTIYRQDTQPTAVLNDVWLNTSKLPLEAKIYTSDGWSEFLKIPVGYFVVSSGNVTTLVTNNYNQNGYNLNTKTGFPMPNYSKKIVQSSGVSYTSTIPGWLFVYARIYAANATANIQIDGVTYSLNEGSWYGTYYSNGMAVFIPVPVGTTYSGHNVNTLYFIPAITV